MSYKTLQSTPISINLPSAARSTGWTIDGMNGVHETCNNGYIEVLGYDLVPGQQYAFTYFINSINGGYVQPFLGDAGGAQQTTAGFKTDTAVASGTNPILRFYSTANVSIRLLTIKNTAVDNNPVQRNTLVYSERQDKWKSFWTYVMDRGASIFTNTYTMKDGRMYVHEATTVNRNNFAGVQYKTIINQVFNGAPGVVKTYVSLSLQSNELMITTVDGIKTSLGQVSELIDYDFLQETLSAGGTDVKVYNYEGVYNAFFLRDKSDDINNGDPLKGDYLLIELVTTTNTVLRLFSIQVDSEHSFNSIR